MTDQAQGTLKDIGTFPHGPGVSHRCYECVTCGTIYPVLGGDRPSCNGIRIRVCPWCHPKGSARARGDHLHNRKAKSRKGSK